MPVEDERRAARFRDKLRSCVVLVSGDGIPGGSGFFIAPNHVLTCAHVVGYQQEQPVTITWQDEEHEGSVVWSSPLGTQSQHMSDGLPDMAIIRAPGAYGKCMRLAEHPEAENGTALFSTGYSHIYHGRPYDANLTSGGPSGPELIRLMGDELPSGISGSPVLNPQTGEICAVVKSARSRNSPRGGYGVLINQLRHAPAGILRTILRENAQYHISDDIPDYVLATIEGAAGENRYMLKTWLFQSSPEGRLVGLMERSGSLSDVRSALDNLLPAALEKAPDRSNVVIQFATPIELLTEPFHEWTLQHEQEELGLQYPVVVRQLLKDKEDEKFLGRANDRRRRQDGTAAISSHRIHCQEKRSRRNLIATLETDEEITALSIPGPPKDSNANEDALSAAQTVGIEVAAIRRFNCADYEHNGTSHPPSPSPSPCEGELFHNAVERKLQVSASKLPQKVLHLRREAAMSEGRALGCDLVMYLDQGIRPPDVLFIPLGG